MDISLDLLFLLAVAVGLVGILLPVLPGSLLIAVAAVAWAVAVSEATGWVVMAIVLGLLGFGQVVKYAVPGQRLKRAGVPTSTLLVGAVLGVVGFFVVPVVGLPVGFVGGVFLAEYRRLRRGPVSDATARASTWAAVKAVVLSVAIELTAGLSAATAMVVGAALT